MIKNLLQMSIHILEEIIKWFSCENSSNFRDTDKKLIIKFLPNFISKISSTNSASLVAADACDFLPVTFCNSSLCLSVALSG